MSRFFSILIACALPLGMAACSGGSIATDMPGTSPRSSEALAGATAPGVSADYAARQQAQAADFAAGAAERAAQWQAILANPGTPNVDYDPQHFDVSFTLGAQVPAQYTGLKPSAGLRAADQTNPTLRQDKSYEALADAIAARCGMTIHQQIYMDGIRLASFDLPANADRAALLCQLKREFAPAIEWATYSRLVHTVWEPNDGWYVNSTATSGDMWGARRIGCSAAWDLSRGDPATLIAVVDSGVRVTHQELASQMIDINAPQYAGFDFDLANDSGDRTPDDTNGHGTGCTGIIGAQAGGGDMKPLVGVAHLCKFIPVKVGNGEVFMSNDSLAGMLVAQQAGAKVINASWGAASSYPGEETAINNMTNAGMLVVAAAGNDNSSGNFYPAAYPSVLCVGSTWVDDSRSSFSNYGPYVDIAAPGDNITMCGAGSDVEYVIGSGTSMAAPYVTGAAGLLWSLEPSLTVDEVRSLLETTGAPTTGFTQSAVKRLNVGLALEGVGAVRIYPPQLTKLCYSGTVTLRPIVHGTPDRIEAWLNGVLVDTQAAAPYNFDFDTSAISYGYAGIEFRAYKGGESFNAQLPMLVDNTSGSFPVTEDFEESQRNLYPLEVKGYALTLLASIKRIDQSLWTQDDVVLNGPAQWNDTVNNPFSNAVCKYYGMAGDSYGNYEIDALVSRRIDLLGVSQPTLVFHQHYNIEDGGSGYDKGWVYVTTDYGKTFTPATLHAGGQAKFTGYLANWSTAEVDLSAFSGQTIQLAFVFESDEMGTGEQAGQPAGWWIDKLTVAENYVEDVPTIGSVSVAPDSVFGDVPAKPQLNITVSDTHNVVRVRYILDCVPIGSVDSYDATVNVTTQPFTTVIDLPGVPNQLAELRVQYFDSNDTPGPEKIVPVYIFNLIGDTNCDGVVGVGDIEGYAGKIGHSAGEPGYVPLFDSDLDGTVQEYDAAAVGYHWGETYP